MATVREYFEKSFPRTLSAEKTSQMKRQLFSGGQIVESTDADVPVRTHIDPDAFAIFASVLLPDCDDALLVGMATELMSKPEIVSTVKITPNVKAPGDPSDHFQIGFEFLDHKLLVKMRGRDGAGGTDEDFVFTRTLYLYVERHVSEAVRDHLSLLALAHNFRLGIRDVAYAEAMDKAVKHIAFVSHDSRDKEEIVRPLVHELARNDYHVWYDEYSLKVGDNLRRSIEKGLMTTRHCIIVLTPHFLSKDTGWPPAELDIVFAREIAEGRQIFLPVWHDVALEQVMAYSPTLGNRLGARWSNGGAKQVAGELIKAIRATSKDA